MSKKEKIRRDHFEIVNLCSKNLYLLIYYNIFTKKNYFIIIKRSHLHTHTHKDNNFLSLSKIFIRKENF